MTSKFMLTLVAFVGWTFLSMWWWRNSVLCACGSTTAAVTVPSTTANQSLPPFYFTGNSGKALSLSAGFAGYLDSLQAATTPDDKLLIKGFWYAGEDTAGIGDLGLYRAARLRDSLSRYFNVANISIASVFINTNNNDSIFRSAVVEKTVTPVISKDRATSVLADGKLIVYFPSNSTKNNFDQQTEQHISDIVNMLQQRGGSIVISGHTDSQGDAEKNKQLGLNRAIKLKDILVQRGINAAQIKTVSYGEEQPIAENETAAGRAINRRAEVTVQQ